MSIRGYIEIEGIVERPCFVYGVAVSPDVFPNSVISQTQDTQTATPETQTQSQTDTESESQTLQHEGDNQPILYCTQDVSITPDYISEQFILKICSFMDGFNLYPLILNRLSPFHSV